MQRFFLEYEQSTISYLKGGNGKKVLLCLHGFGENAESFAFLEKHLGDIYTIYAPDFPWHGRTEWRQPLSFQVNGMIAVMERMMDTYHSKKFELLTYSMGGRVGLSLLQHIPHKIDKAVFLAPDGLKVNFWYWLATQTRAGNSLFQYTMNNPKWFSRMVDLLKRLGWINISIAKFVHTYIDRKQIRDDLYHIWTTMRKFRPHLKAVKQEIFKRHIPVHFVFGEYDRIIPAKNGYKFQKGVENIASIDVLKAGHQFLREKHVESILKILTQ